MDFADFLSSPDAERADRTLATLRRHRTEAWVLTGGIAIELHLLRLGLQEQRRELNDIDFIADSFDNVPSTIAADLLFRHVHPHEPPAKTLLQCIDPQTRLRVDLFRAYGNTVQRATQVELAGEAVSCISLEDLTARTARLCMDLATNTPTDRKHTCDFLRLVPWVDVIAMEQVWTEHRKPGHPASFDGVAHLLVEMIASKTDLQFQPVYSRNINAICDRCEDSTCFPLASAEEIRALLGYC
ncbi:MAG: hypothetical protein ABR976_13155 [Terracidiphilus sp.]|jgi:hypothetical protein